MIRVTSVRRHGNESGHPNAAAARVTGAGPRGGVNRPSLTAPAAANGDFTEVQPWRATFGN